MIGLAPPEILKGIETPVSLLGWRSWKLDRKVLGSNGAEAQGIYEGEDKGWKYRLLWSQMHGERINRKNAELLAAKNASLLVMDSKGCYDALTRLESHGLGMKHDRDGVQMLGLRAGTTSMSRQMPTWCPGDLNLGDSLTKDTLEARRCMAYYLAKKTWRIRFDPDFVSARKRHRLTREQETEYTEETSEGLQVISEYMAEWDRLDYVFEYFGGERTM